MSVSGQGGVESQGTQPATTASSQFVKAMDAAKVRQSKRAEARQDSMLESVLDSADDQEVNLLRQTVRKKSKSLKERRAKRAERAKKGLDLQVKQDVDDQAQDYSQKNYELKKDTLLQLRERLSPNDTMEEILEKVLTLYEDPFLADEALEFLTKTTGGNLKKAVEEAREELNKNSGQEITAGKNIRKEVEEFSKSELDSPKSLRELYQKITHTPKEPTTLFGQLSKQYPYKKLSKVIKFLFHSIGTDLRSKGPSIPKGLLHNLFQQTRTLQMILGVYRFFAQRMSLVDLQYKQNQLSKPNGLTFESLAKLFMQIAGERYPTGDRILRQANSLGIKELMEKIIVLSQYRDGVRNVAANQIYRSIQHRYDLYQAFIDALEELEYELECQEEEEKAKKKKEEEEEEEEEE